MKLLLCKAEGTSYEHFVHNMVEVEVEYTLRYMDVLRRLGREVPELSQSLCHIIASGMMGGLFEIVVHDMPKEQAPAGCRTVPHFLHGWMAEIDGGMTPIFFEY